jgi:hypothetical protein
VEARYVVHQTNTIAASIDLILGLEKVVRAPCRITGPVKRPRGGGE